MTPVIFGLNGVPVESALTVPMVDLWYPGCDGNATELEIGLVSVRAADSIIVSYDMQRDGWVIKQSRYVDELEWVEVAFVQAWALREEP